MRADFVHHVKKMHDNSGWELIRKIVLEDGEDVITSELEEIGTEIVRNVMNPSPAAAQVSLGVVGDTRIIKHFCRSSPWSLEVTSNIFFPLLFYKLFEEKCSALSQIPPRDDDDDGDDDNDDAGLVRRNMYRRKKKRRVDGDESFCGERR
ncbi:uncharacterized protein LOC122050317 [Zingiber officinale]|uniref:uncharacterized protein LOC122050317 n=1 Tax=Zingiber officinale TaxID=94328 RepID=UPI001C4BF185|nr:uncharacterized protein LOC122050317 [Zingiber officinale]